MMALQDISVLTVGQLQPSHGFSSLKFVPNTQDKEVGKRNRA
jgi:hypothetical protein